MAPGPSREAIQAVHDTQPPAFIAPRRKTAKSRGSRLQEAALRVADGTAGPESMSLAAKLERMTGVSISELAVLAEDWPDA
jgi:hypothetical protein